MRFSGILIALCIGGISFSSVVVADPPWMRDSGYEHSKHKQKRHKHHKRRHHDDEYEYREVYEHDGHGPPPWAPAHGYRDQQYRESSSVVVEIPVVRERYYEQSHDYHGSREPSVSAEVDFNATSDKIGISNGTCNRETAGAVMGGLIGGIIGNKTSARKDRTFGTLAGTIFGAIIGKEIGRNMDENDAKCSNQVLERARDGQNVRWENPNNDSKYEMTPTKTYQQKDGRYCRDYTTTVYTGAQKNSYSETACRNDQGIWARPN